MFVLSGWGFEVQAGHYEQAVASVRGSLAGWVELGLAFERSASGARFFDPVEMVNFVTRAGVEGLDQFWRDRLVVTGRKLAGYGFAPEALPPAPVDVRLRRTLDVRQAEGASKIRLRMPLPLRGAYLRDLAIVPVIAPEFAQGLVLRDGVLELRLARPANPLVEIGADVCFTALPRFADPAAGRLDPAEAELYLRGNEGVIRVSPHIEALANRLAGAACDALATIDRFWDYLLDEFFLGAVNYDQVPADAPCDWVLDSGWYDCQLGAALLVALCRARHIPARIVAGHFLSPLAPTKHFWAEIWVDGCGWLPYDLQCWQLSAAGRDLEGRRHFAGRLDYRMPTQCLPLEFTGPMSVRVPSAWHLLSLWKDGELHIPMSKLNGDLLFSDRIRVRFEDRQSSI